MKKDEDYHSPEQWRKSDEELIDWWLERQPEPMGVTRSNAWLCVNTQTVSRPMRIWTVPFNTITQSRRRIEYSRGHDVAKKRIIQNSSVSKDVLEPPDFLHLVETPSAQTFHARYFPLS